ncbi:MAG: hypothetical protein ACLQQ4_06400 [Bacteroidia bacterium]
MKKTINKHAESLKKRIDGASKKSKEKINSVIESNVKRFDSAMENNKRSLDAISKVLEENEIDPSIVSVIKSAFIKSVKLSEEAIDSTIDSHARRVDLSIDFASMFMEILKSEDFTTKDGVNKLVELVHENFKKSTELSMDNIEKIMSVYNNYLNMTLNFNKTFAEKINAQIASMFTMQKKNIDIFFPMNLINEWWKNIGE